MMGLLRLFANYGTLALSRSALTYGRRYTNTGSFLTSDGDKPVTPTYRNRRRANTTEPVV